MWNFTISCCFRVFFFSFIKLINQFDIEYHKLQKKINKMNKQKKNEYLFIILKIEKEFIWKWKNYRWIYRCRKYFFFKRHKNNVKQKTFIHCRFVYLVEINMLLEYWWFLCVAKSIYFNKFFFKWFLTDKNSKTPYFLITNMSFNSRIDF